MLHSLFISHASLQIINLHYKFNLSFPIQLFISNNSILLSLKMLHQEQNLSKVSTLTPPPFICDIYTFWKLFKIIIFYLLPSIWYRLPIPGWVTYQYSWVHCRGTEIPLDKHIHSCQSSLHMSHCRRYQGSHIQQYLQERETNKVFSNVDLGRRAPF